MKKDFGAEKPKAKGTGVFAELSPELFNAWKTGNTAGLDGDASPLAVSAHNLLVLGVVSEARLAPLPHQERIIRIALEGINAEDPETVRELVAAVPGVRKASLALLAFG